MESENTMIYDFKNFEKILAQNKVYDAWQYTQSLCETMSYMELSYEMLKKVHQHRKETLANVKKEKMKEMCESGKTAVMVSDLKRTYLDVGGYELDDIVFLRKTAMEFFHYGRMSMDVLFQIINAALLGDEAFSVEDKKLLGKILNKMDKKPEFANLCKMLESNKNDNRFQYLMAFDNYMKHIKTILITVENNFLIGDGDKFEINEFSYGKSIYHKEDALTKIQEIHDYIDSTVPLILSEIAAQVPNCISNASRIQEIHYKYVFSEHGGRRNLDYVSFFIDVPNGLSDLPSEIKVFPLLIKPNDEIYSCHFNFNKIFIKKIGSDEPDVIGVATLKNGLATNEFYRVYEVQPCKPIDYGLYVATFKENYTNRKISINIYSMDGKMLYINE